MDTIKVSVIIPAYNVEKYIEQCVRSVMDQTLREIEIIVINDGSTDSTLAIIRQLSQEDSRIIVVEQENKGLSSTRNVGLKLSRGKYIQHLDGDDWIDYKYLEDAYYFAEKHNLDILVFDYLKYYSENNMVYIKDFKSDHILSGEEYREIYFEQKVARTVWNKFILRDLYFKNDIFFIPKISMGEDFAVTSRLAYVVNKIGKIDKAYVYYRQNPESMTKRNRSKDILPYLSIFDEIEAYLSKKDLYNEEEENRIYRYKLMDLQNFVNQDFDWNSEEYNQAVSLYLSIVKDKKFLKNLDALKVKWKIVNIFVRLFPFKFFIKILVFVLNRKKG